MASNASSTMASQMPSALPYTPSILDTFIPGYSVISGFIFESFGIDGSRFVPIFVIMFSAAAAVSFLYRQLSADVGDIIEFFTSNIVIENKEAIYDDFSKWISTKKVSELARTIRVISPNKSNLGPQEDLDGAPAPVDAESQKGFSIFNFSRAEASKPLRFEPYFGRYYFWHRGNFFMLEKYEKSQLQVSRRHDGPTDKEYIKLSCLGMSTGPIKRLIEEARSENFENRMKTTRVFRPNNEIHRRYGSIDEKWRLVAHRPCRPIETINLDEKEKDRIVQDFNSFLQPLQANWYATKGIPYRRGYLFHGPPGTGKTSLSYALAGLFGVSIYGASLQDPELNEEDLCELLNALPHRCIVLLEDIDAAGLRRDLKDKEEAKARKKSKKNPYRSWREEPKISLSGLLNAIDGVAAHEGHLLIMTSNCPEKLDDALKRPGRVDLQVEFTLASKVQVHDIYKRMYMSEVAIAHPIEVASKSSDEKDVLPSAFATEAELEDAANKFTSFFKDFQFSPAEVQGFLLFHKTDPKASLEKAEEWIRTTLEAKEKEKKLREEQDAELEKEMKKEEDEEKDKKNKDDKTSSPPSSSTGDEVNKAFAELLRKMASGSLGESSSAADESKEESEDKNNEDNKTKDEKAKETSTAETNGHESETKPATNGEAPELKVNGVHVEVTPNGETSETIAKEDTAKVTVNGDVHEKKINGVTNGVNGHASSSEDLAV